MIKPLSNKVFMESLEDKKTTESGIVLPDSSDKQSMKAKVVAVGPGKLNEKGEVIPMNVKVGDKVLFTQYATTDIKMDGKKYLICSEDDILGVLEN